MSPLAVTGRFDQIGIARSIEGDRVADAPLISGLFHMVANLMRLLKKIVENDFF